MSAGKSTRKTVTRSEIVTVRLEPKLRYLAELAARKQRRTLSSFIEWAVERSLDLVEIGPGNATIAARAGWLWDVDEVDRFIRLAFYQEDLMNHEEQVLWKLIRDNNYYWVTRQQEKKTGKSPSGKPTTALIPVPTISPETVLRERLRDAWPKLLAVARGQASAEILPKPIDFPEVSFIGGKNDPERMFISIGPIEEVGSEDASGKRDGKKPRRKG